MCNKIKVLYLSNALTHYYNRVLSKLASHPGVDLVVVAPFDNLGSHVGDGVYQTNLDVNFKLIQLEEYKCLGVFTTFKDLSRVIRNERPDIVVTLKPYIAGFLVIPKLILAIYIMKCALVLKEIPTGVPFGSVLKKIIKKGRPFSSFGILTNRLLIISGLERAIRLTQLYFERVSLNFPDAYVNYIEAPEYWASYGVDDMNVFVIRNSPDTDLLLEVNDFLFNKPERRLKANPYRIIHVGRLVEWKRVDILLVAIASIKKTIPEIELLIVGSGPHRADLELLVDRLDLRENVNFLGGVYDPYELGEYLQDSAVYVLAGMGGLSINEAMCFGKPVICSIGDGTEKFLVRNGFNGLYFNEGDADDLRNKLMELILNPDLLADMGKNSLYIIKEEINIHTVIDGYYSAFKHAMDKKNDN